MQDIFEHLRITPHRFRTSEGLPTTLEVTVTGEKEFSRFSGLGGLEIGDAVFVNPYNSGGESLSSPHKKCEDIIKKTEGSILVFTHEGNMPSFFVRTEVAKRKDLGLALQQIYEIILARVKKAEENRGEDLPERRLSDYYTEVDVSYLKMFYNQIMKETPDFRRELLTTLPCKQDDFLSDYNAVIRRGMLLDPPKNQISAMMIGRILAHIVDRETLQIYARPSPHASNYLAMQHQFFKTKAPIMDRVFSKLCDEMGIEQALKS